MKELTNTSITNEKKFSSRYLVEQINIFRKTEGNKSELLHKNFLVKLESEFEDEIGELKIQPTSYLDASNRQSKQYELTFEQSLQMLMSESKTVRKQCIAVMREQQKQITELTKPKEVTRLEMAKMLVAAEEEVETLKAELEIAAPKIEIYDMAMDSQDALNMNDTAKILKLGYGRNRLFAKLRDAGILMSNNRPYQRYINSGWFRVIEKPYLYNHHTSVQVTTLVLQKGLSEIVNVVKTV